MLHFPPFGDRKEGSGFTELLEKIRREYRVCTAICTAKGLRTAFNGGKTV